MIKSYWRKSFAGHKCRSFMVRNPIPTEIFSFKNVELSIKLDGSYVMAVCSLRLHTIYHRIHESSHESHIFVIHISKFK